MNQQKPKEIDFKDISFINDKILEIYPFLTKKEKINFEKKTKKFILNEKLFNKNKFIFLEKLLNFLKNPHAQVLYKLKRKKNRKNISPIEIKISKRILYIRIKSWSAKNKEEAIDLGDKIINICERDRKKYDSIIFDVRSNGGGWSMGADKIATIFFKKKFTSAYILRRNKNKVVKKERILNPNEKIYIDAPIVMLTDNKCFSSNELFISPFKIGKRAIIIGEKTRGGSANPITLDYFINNKEAVIRIPTWRLILKGEKKPIEYTKIKPDIFYNKKNIVKYAFGYLLEKK